MTLTRIVMKGPAPRIDETLFTRQEGTTPVRLPLCQDIQGGRQLSVSQFKRHSRGTERFDINSCKACPGGAAANKCGVKKHQPNDVRAGRNEKNNRQSPDVRS